MAGMLITLQGSGWAVFWASSAWELICLLKVYKLDAMTFKNYSRSLANSVRWMTQYKGV